MAMPPFKEEKTNKQRTFKMFLAFALCVLWLPLALSVRAQTSCNDNPAIMDKKGKWTKSKDVNHDYEISQAQLKEADKRIDDLFGYIREAYPQPVGCEPEWYRSIERRKFKSPVPDGPQPYSFSSLFKKYHCDKRLPDLQLETETNTWVWIIVNQYSWLFAKSAEMTIDGKQVQTYHMPTKAGEINGHPYYWLSSWSPYSKTLLFTRKGESLFTPVTRRQYLEWYISDHVRRNKESEARLMNVKIRPAEVQEAEKNKQLQKVAEQAAKTSERRKNAAVDSFLKTYRTDEERRDENLRRFRETSEKELRKYYSELNNPDQASLNRAAWFCASKGVFCDEERKGGWMPVVMNESYFKKHLPPLQPQMIIMHWSVSEKHIADRFLNDQLENKFPFDKLQALVDQ